MELLKSHKCFEGSTQFWEHFSEVTRTKMKFATFTPPDPVRGCLIWLSGLTCNEENFITKAGAQRYLTEQHVMVVCPDTSPRGLNLPGEHDSSDFGSSAGFYVDATTAEYSDHYRMYSYISQELYALIQARFCSRISIFGHSMGGHGALVFGLREPEKFRSVSAFAPIVNPSQSPWGIKAFTGYLGDDKTAWLDYDACELLNNGHTHPQAFLIDQGTADGFLTTQLLPERILEASAPTKQKIDLRFHEGYDHSYYFISTFIQDHIRFHAQQLTAQE